MSEGPGTDEPTGSGLAVERTRRRAHVEQLRAAGSDPYPYRFDRTHTLGEVRRKWGDLEPGTETGDEVAVAGRILLWRDTGKLIFATIGDRRDDLQLFISKSVIGDEAFAAAKQLDLGDLVGVSGAVMTTRTGELSVRADRIDLLAKALRPLPDKWKGLTDVDTRFRQRYTDLIVNADARRTFEIRHEMVTSFRRTLASLDFVEVETPVLHVDAGGALARPFVTHHNALDMDLHLRIAIELHLKRLIVGGLERVYEIGRVFRNEGTSPRHNPEFSMLELYQAYGDHTEMMSITQRLIVTAAEDALGSTQIDVAGERVDLAGEWPRRRMIDLVAEATGVEVHPTQPLEVLRELAASHGVAMDASWGTGKLIEELFEETAEASIKHPTFVTGHPLDISPLARQDRDDPALAERFELFVDTSEIANGYSELNDPVEQRARFESEQQLRDAGDAERGTIDEDYLRALELGMPPTGGLGVGIDRLAMLLAGVDTIKEVILFPTLRPER